MPVAEAPAKKPVEITEFLRYEFTEDEIKEKGAALARSVQQQQLAQEEQKAAAAQFKERIERFNSEIGRYSREVSNGLRDAEHQMPGAIPHSGAGHEAHRATGYRRTGARDGDGRPRTAGRAIRGPMIHPVPKPPPRDPKQKKPLKRTPIKKRRSKARRGRLRGEAMSTLRQESWAERRSLCFYCHRPCSEEWDDLAHIRGKGMWGDNKENVSPAHKECHRTFHAYGPSMRKPVPAKEKEQQ